MIDMSELLEQAAGDDEVGFDARDVRRRVRRRRRVRATTAVLSAVAVLGGVGAAGLALATRDGDRGRVEVAGTPDANRVDLVGRWRPVAYSAVVVPPDGVRLEFSADGTFRGHDGCNGFAGEWSVDDSRLVTGNIESEGQLCPPEQDTRLVRILANHPTIAASEVQTGAIELRSDDDWVAFERVETDAVGPTDSPTDRPAECSNRQPNSPSAFDPSAGTYAAYLHAVDPDTASVSFNIVQWLSGDAAIRRYRQDNPDDQAGTPPNDYYIANDSDQKRTARFPDAEIHLPEARVAGAPVNTPGTPDELADYVSNHDSEVFWLTFHDDQIIEICRQYRP